MYEGGAKAIAARGQSASRAEVPGDDVMLDRAAMEAGTD